MIFLSKSDTINYLKSDPDQYYSTFTELDLMARNVSNINEYISKIPKSISSFTPSEKNKIKKYISDIDQKLQIIKMDYFNGAKASKIPWIIACVDGEGYENGFSHTRNNLIILSRSAIDRKTLLHEKVHVYYKMYPKDRHKYLSNFQKCQRSKNVRANPDTDPYTYRDKKRIYECTYRPHPRSIDDIIGPNQYEHPLEKIAYDISKAI